MYFRKRWKNTRKYYNYLTIFFLPTRLKTSTSAISSRAHEILFKEVTPMDNSVVYFDFKCGMILPRTKKN